MPERGTPLGAKPLPAHGSNVVLAPDGATQFLLRICEVPLQVSFRARDRAAVCRTGPDGGVSE